MIKCLIIGLSKKHTIICIMAMIVVSSFLILLLPFDIYTWRLTEGNDELRAKKHASEIINQNAFLHFPKLLGITNSFHFGNAYLLAITFKLTGKWVYFIWLKLAIKIYTIFKLYKFLMNFNPNLAYFSVTLLALYPPIFLMGFTYLRDDLIVYFIILSALSIANKQYVSASALLSSLLFLRLTGILLVVALFIYCKKLKDFQTFGTFKTRRFKESVLGYGFLILFLGILTYWEPAFLTYVISKSVELLGYFRYGFIFCYELFKIPISPLPWNVLNENTFWIYIFPWFTFSTIFALPLLIKIFRFKNLQLFAVPYLFILLYLTPYLLGSAFYDALGPRQLIPASIIFIFLYVTGFQIKSHTFKANPNQERNNPFPQK